MTTETELRYEARLRLRYPSTGALTQEQTDGLNALTLPVGATFSMVLGSLKQADTWDTAKAGVAIIYANTSLKTDLTNSLDRGDRKAVDALLDLGEILGITAEQRSVIDAALDAISKPYWQTLGVLE